MDFFLCHIPCSENQTLRKLKLLKVCMPQKCGVMKYCLVLNFLIIFLFLLLMLFIWVVAKCTFRYAAGV